MRKKEVYETTTDQRTYRIIRLHHVELGCCLRCKRRSSQKWYCLFNEKSNKLRSRYPNWKMVSKSKKQWVKKPIHIHIEDGKGWKSIKW